MVSINQSRDEQSLFTDVNEGLPDMQSGGITDV